MDQSLRDLCAAAAAAATGPCDLDVLLDGLVAGATRALGAERGSFFLVDPVSGELVSRVAQGAGRLRIPPGEGTAGLAVTTGGLAYSPPGEAARRIDRETGFVTRTALAAPVPGPDGSVAAVFEVLNRPQAAPSAGDRLLLGELVETFARVLRASSLAGQLRGVRPLAWRINHLVGDSLPMRRLADRLARVAPTEVTVLIRGETGTGKELVAQAVHVNSARRHGPLVKVDCAALPAALLENELFGHERGAYTGADRDADGKVAAARGGTLFLDELGELPLDVQGKLLRLLQDRTYHRVGAAQERRADVRFVAATHVDLAARVASGRFRADLWYRLRGVTLDLPPLRERGPADLDRLVDHFLHRHRIAHRRPGLGLTAAARERLHRCPWPGNVRELEMLLEAAVILAEGPSITVEDLGIEAVADAPPVPAAEPVAPDAVRPLAEVEREAVRAAVSTCGGNRAEAARRLGIGRNTLARKLAGR